MSETSITGETETRAARDQDPVWVKSKFSNLWKYAPSGVYYCRAKVNGRQLRVSLKTKSIEIAKIKLDRLLMAERGRLYNVEDDKITFEHLAAEYVDRISQDPKLKPGAKKYRLETLLQVRRSWPDDASAILKETTDAEGVKVFVYAVDSLSPSQFTEVALLNWAKKLREKYSPTRFNGAVQTMRAVLQVAVDRGLLLDNPARAKKRNSIKGIQAASVPIVAPTIPEAKQFEALLKCLDSKPERKRAARMVRFLAFSGARIGSARQIYPHNIDMARNQIILPAVKYDTEPIRIPMNQDLRSLCEEMIADYPGKGPLIGIKNPRRALKKACEEAGLPAMKNHTLRHLHTSACIEAGVDLRCIAEWLGHRDGGKLLSRVYAHTRDEHSQNMAAKVKFLQAPPTESTPNNSKTESKPASTQEASDLSLAHG